MANNRRRRLHQIAPIHSAPQNGKQPPPAAFHQIASIHILPKFGKNKKAFIF
jgi:hypothetical protein